MYVIASNRCLVVSSDCALSRPLCKQAKVEERDFARRVDVKLAIRPGADGFAQR
jgi:hypothetical protein